jgi:hypothetical protein
MRLADKYKADCLARAGRGQCERTVIANLKE